MSHTPGVTGLDDDEPRSDADTDAIDAIELLHADHDEVLLMFEDYESLLSEEATDDERARLARRICTALSVHAAIEEEILYPIAGELLDDQRLVEVALSEHANADELIGELRSMSIDEPLFDEKVAALSVVIQRHIDAEEEDLLPLLSQQGADLQNLGERMAERKLELLDEQAQEE
jgi:hemerythrin-like domain-containing protein